MPVPPPAWYFAQTGPTSLSRKINVLNFFAARGSNQNSAVQHPVALFR